MIPAPARPPPGRREDYVRFLPLTLRLADNDILGHVNNAHYYSLFDTTICEFLVREGMLQGRVGSALLVVAESGCRYHREIAFPDRITGGMKVTQIGERSVRWGVGLFRDDEVCASAEGFAVHVCVSAATGRPTALPEEWRAVFERLMIVG